MLMMLGLLTHTAIIRVGIISLNDHEIRNKSLGSCVPFRRVRTRARAQGWVLPESTSTWVRLATTLQRPAMMDTSTGPRRLRCRLPSCFPSRDPGRTRWCRTGRPLPAKHRAPPSTSPSEARSTSQCYSRYRAAPCLT